MQGHPRLPVIRSGLEEEVRVHNGEDIPREWAEDSKDARAERSPATQTGRGVAGPPPAAGSEGRRAADQEEAQCSAGSRQVGASPLGPLGGRWGSPARDSTGYSLPGVLFYPAMSVLPAGPSGRRRGLRARGCGEQVAGAGPRRRLRRVRAQLLFMRR